MGICFIRARAERIKDEKPVKQNKPSGFVLFEGTAEGSLEKFLRCYWSNLSPYHNVKVLQEVVLKDIKQRNLIF